MIMLYVTIIIVAVLSTVCILGWKYLSTVYSDSVYEQVTINDVNIIVSSLLNKLAVRDATDEKDKYRYQVYESEFKTALEEIKNMTEFNIK